MEAILKKTENPRYQVMLEIAKLRDAQLKAACVERGFEASKLGNASLAEITTWLIDHYNDPVDSSKLKVLKKEYPLIHKSGNIQFKTQAAPVTQNNIPKTKNIQKSPKREKDTEFGIFKGTKKDYTYNLSKDLYQKLGKKYSAKELIAKFSDKLYQKVVSKFGQASEKSVKIWMKRFLDTQKF